MPRFGMASIIGSNVPRMRPTPIAGVLQPGGRGVEALDLVGGPARGS